MATFDAKMDTIFYDSEEALENEDCKISITDQEIKVSYDAEDGNVLYCGENNADGHFILRCIRLDAMATLHRIPQSKYLEGYWTEEGERGFWRIKLP